ncbi:MAG: hypothetical protein ACYTGC_15635 [Planctomycetota bacterium]
MEPLPRPVDWLVGRRIPELDGLVGASAAAGAPRPLATVIAIRDVTCPLSKRYGPRLASIEDEFASRGVEFVFLNLSAHDDRKAIVGEVKQFGFDGRYVHDPGGRLGAALRTISTTEVFVLDRARTLVYRGAVDDQYGIGHVFPAPRQQHLRLVLEDVLGGRVTPTRSTLAPGCLVSTPDTPPTDDAPTYHGRVSRILDAHCVGCHRAGAVGPFTLDTHESVAGRRAMVRAVVLDGLMPPWHMADGLGPWANDRSLSAEDRTALLTWIDAGCPEGDPAVAPIARNPEETAWQIGRPDAVVRLPEPVRVPAEGAMDYQYAWVKTDFGEDKWVTALEFLPDAPEVVHHALIFLEEPRKEEESRREYRRRWQGGLRGYFAGLVPGQGPTVYPDGLAKRIPAGAWIKFQMHYTPSGVATSDRTAVAFVFADAPPREEIRTSSVATMDFEIPAGAPDVEVHAETRLREDAWLLSVSPHMHLRGRGTGC